MLLKGIKEIGKGKQIKLPVWRMMMLILCWASKHTLRELDVYRIVSKLFHLGDYVQTHPPKKKINTRIFLESKLPSTCWTAQMEKFPRGLELRSLKGRRQKWESLECFRNSMPYFSFDWRWVNIPTSAILKISANFTPFLLSALWNFSLYSDVCITSCYLAAHPKLSAESMERDPYLFCLSSGGCAVF